MPVDPVSDGTWIGASDAGLVAVLMNIYSRGNATVPATISTRRTPALSRGGIIPRVLEAANLPMALSLARELEHERFEPFRLVMLDRRHIAQLEWLGGQTHVLEPAEINHPWFFTSSGLGDSVVATPRQQLFQEMFAGDSPWSTAQDAFHRHSWPGNGPASVWMTRPEAMTVSLTEILLGPDRVAVTYRPRVADTGETSEVEPISLAIQG
jgi:hypothetical protein